MLTNYLSDIGKLDRIVTVLKPDVTTVNDFGHKSNTYLTTDMNAALSYKQRAEKMISGKDTQIDIKVFIIRYTALSLTDKMRYESKDYDIIDIEEVGRRRYLKVTCKCPV